MLSQRPGYTHVHLTESQVTDLDYTHGPGDQGASLHGHGAHHESIEVSAVPVEGETQEPRVTLSGVTLSFLNHQVGFYAPLSQYDWLRPQISASHWLLTAQS